VDVRRGSSGCILVTLGLDHLIDLEVALATFIATGFFCARDLSVAAEGLGVGRGIEWSRGAETARQVLTAFALDVAVWRRRR
jgi:hypothetical protein